MDSNAAFFGAAAPPAPFHIGVLQILFQMGCLISILLLTNFVIENLSNGGWVRYVPWKTEEKKEVIVEITDLPAVTKDMLFDLKLGTIVIAMNDKALTRCLPISRKYNGDNVTFCKINPSITIGDDLTPSPLDASFKLPLEINSKYDMLAVKEGGKVWTGIIFLELESKKESDVSTNNKFQLSSDVLDAWILRILLGVTPWVSSKEKKIPIIKS